MLYLQLQKKNKDFLEFTKNLKYNQRIVFSDEGNLIARKYLVGSDQKPTAQSKPYGLWYSFGPAWVEYLSSDYEDAGDPEQGIPGDNWCAKWLARYTHIYKLSLRRDKIAKLDTKEDYVDFTNYYGTKNKKGIYWNRVAKDWSGVEIRFRRAALELFPWYDNWDCSSGCIWKPDALRSIKLIAEWKMLFAQAK